MTDRRRQRSAAPEDAEAFAPPQLPRLQAAVEHLSQLQALGYEGTAPLALVGDHFQLTARQRHAVRRCACSEAKREARWRKQVDFEDLVGRRVVVDGFNVLITLETALGGGVVLRGRDGCLRDLAHLRGTWRRVLQTPGAISLLGETLAQSRVAEVEVLVDARVSNSGRLMQMLREAACDWPFAFTCEAADRVDARLMASEAIVASADSVVIDGCDAWTNLAQVALEVGGVKAWLIDLGGS